MPNLGDDSMVASIAAKEEADPGLSEAEASSNAAQQLLHGAIVSDLVSLHARCAAGFCICICTNLFCTCYIALYRDPASAI